MATAISRRQALGWFSAAGCAALARSGFAFAEEPAASLIAAPLRVDLRGLAGRRPRGGAHHRGPWAGANAAMLDQALAAAVRHGIDAQGVRAQLGSLRPGPSRDAAFTRVALAYAHALSSGLCDPRAVFPIYTIARNQAEVAGGLQRALRSGRLGPWLESLAPQDEEYARLSAAYVDAARRSDVLRPEQIADGPKIRPGDADPRVAQVAARLGAPAAQLAEAAPPAAAFGGASTSPANDPLSGADASPPLEPSLGDAPVYGPALVQAVKAYQRANGLRADGVIGPETLSALNAGPDDRARALALNLERRRWLARDPAPTRIDVNIPSQTLVYFKDGDSDWTTRVAVGRTDDQTPDIQASFSQLTVNPPWHVPASIIRTEIREKGPDYLKRQHMRWTHGGLVQAPGPWAALGLVKFDLRDPYDIYLHDTPAKGVFDDSERDLSHGCVRVEGAVEFARKLAEESGAAEVFDAALASGRTEGVALGRSIPVRLLYHTAFLDDAGQVTFRPDIYGRDAALADALGMAPLNPDSPPALPRAGSAT